MSFRVLCLSVGLLGGVWHISSCKRAVKRVNKVVHGELSRTTGTPNSRPCKRANNEFFCES